MLIAKCSFWASSVQYQETSIQQPASSIKQPASSNQHQASSIKQPASSNQQPTTHNPQPTTHNPQPTIMSYSEFTLKELKKKFGLRIKEGYSMFPETPSFEISDFLSEFLENGIPLARAIGTDKAKAEFIIAPVLAEIRKVLKNKISLFSGINFKVNPKRGLTGVCDFILSSSEQQLELNRPVLTVVEARNENINAGIPRCIAEMIGARIFNAREGNGIKYVFGCVTTGTVWKFLKYSRGVIFIDVDDYYIRDINEIMGIFLEIMALFIFRLTVFPRDNGLPADPVYNLPQLQNVFANRKEIS